jgi:hypothetical protein
MSDMQTKQFQLDEQSLDQLLRINASIEHQSVQYTKARLQLSEMESGIRGLYNARQQLLNRCIAAQDINPNLVTSINLDEKGVTVIEVRDPPVAPVAPTPPNGAPSDPPS